MDWQNSINLFKQKPEAGPQGTGENSSWNLLQDYGNVAVVVNGYTGRYAIITPTGTKVSEPTRYDLSNQATMDGLLNAARQYVNINEVKNPDGTWRPAVYGGSGSDYQTAPSPAAAPSPAPTPAAAPAPAAASPSAPSPAPAAPPSLPAGYQVTGQEPSGWATGPDGHMAKISDIQSSPVASSSPSSAGAAPAITGDPAAQRAALQAAGIDPNLLSDSQVSALYLMQTYSDSQAQRDKQIAPASLSQADMDKFLSDAKAEYEPYYQGQFDIAKNSLLQAVGVISGDNTYLEQKNAADFQVQNEQAAQQAAAAGLARSGIRQLAEQRLKEQQTGLVESGRRKAQNDLYQLGSSFEKDYGAAGLAKAGGAPAIQSAGNAALGIAPTTIGYNPIGVAGGGAKGAEQATAERQEQSRLAQLEASKRLNNAYGSTATNLP